MGQLYFGAVGHFYIGANTVNYLIEAGFVEQDTGTTVLQYYNSANPSAAWAGAGNNGTAQATARQGLVSLVAKAGVAALAGTQMTPAPDPGYVGLYVVTVVNGQVSVTSSNISAYASAPFVYQPLIEWTATQGYPNEAYVVRNGLTYKSLVANVGQDPATASAYWVRWGYTGAQLAAFIAGAGLTFSGVVPLAVSSTLTTANLGKLLEVTTAGTTQTLPPVATCAAGAVMTLLAQYAYGGATTTVQANAAESIANQAGVTANSFVLNGSESLCLVSDGTKWNVLLYVSAVANGQAGNAINSIVPTTTAVTAVPGTRYVLTGSAGVAVTLPASAVAGQKVGVKDLTASYASTVSPNGSKIDGTSGTMTINTLGAALTFEYVNSNIGWVIE